MDLAELLQLAGQKGGYGIALLVGVWYVAPAAAKAINAKAAAWKVREAGKAVEDLNGKLIAAVGRGIETQQKRIVDDRIEDFIARNGHRWDALEAKQEDQCERLERVEQAVGDVSRTVARIDGRLEGMGGRRQ